MDSAAFNFHERIHFDLGLNACVTSCTGSKGNLNHKERIKISLEHAFASSKIFGLQKDEWWVEISAPYIQSFYNSSLRRYRESLVESSRKFKFRRGADGSEPSKKEKVCNYA